MNAVAVGIPGSGKSNFLQKFVLEVARLEGRIICLDFKGDYSTPDMIRNAHLQHVPIRELRLNPFASSDDPLQLARRIADALQEPFQLDSNLDARLRVILFDFLKIRRGGTFGQFLDWLKASGDNRNQDLLDRLSVLWADGQGVFRDGVDRQHH